MKILLGSLVLCSSTLLHAQYYYNDIVGTQETNRQMQTYLANKVKSVSADGYSPDGTRATDFTEVREIKENGRALKIVTITNFNKVINYSRFDDQGRVISTIDSSLGVGNTTAYRYDNVGRIVTVENIVKDPESEINNVELHQWYYNKDGKPERMLRTMNGADSVEVRFLPDEKGNPGDEISYRKGKEIDHIYYYFDEKGRVTDVVRYNDKIKKLVPDNMITYDDNDHAIQVVSVMPEDKFKRTTWVNYQTWRYVFNDKGLKSAEALFNTDNEMTGRVKYNYTFAQ